MPIGYWSLLPKLLNWSPKSEWFWERWGAINFWKEVKLPCLADAEDTKPTSIYSATKEAGFRTLTGPESQGSTWYDFNWALPAKTRVLFYQGQIACQRHFYKNLPKYRIKLSSQHIMPLCVQLQRHLNGSKYRIERGSLRKGVSFMCGGSIDFSPDTLGKDC